MDKATKEAIKAQRIAPSKLARDRGLKKTARAIKTKCFEDIFSTALKEAGRDKVFELLLELGDLDWIYKFARTYSKPKLNEEQKACVVKAVLDNVDPRLAHHFACASDEIGFTKNQVELLINKVVKTKNVSDAFFVALTLSDNRPWLVGLMLNVVVESGDKDYMRKFLQNVYNLTFSQREILESSLRV